jgi:hypothetical protein
VKSHVEFNSTEQQFELIGKIMKKTSLASAIVLAASLSACGTAPINSASSLQSSRSGRGPFKIASCGNGVAGLQFNVSADIAAHSAKLLGFGGAGSATSEAYKFAGDIEKTDFNVSIISAGSFTEKFTYSLTSSTNYVESPHSSSELSRVDLSFVKIGRQYIGSVDLVYRSGYLSEFSHFDSCTFSNVEELLFKVAR